MERLHALREGRSTMIVSSKQATPDFDGSAAEPESLNDDLDFSVQPLEIDDVEPDPLPDDKIPAPKRVRRSKPDLTMERLYQHWRCLLPTLVGPYARYHSRTLAKPLGPIPPTLSLCTQPVCTKKTTRIVCLLFDHFTTVDVVSCACATLPQVLVDFRLFPASPSQPRLAVSLDLLGFYRALFERSCDAINALAAALRTHYTRRGFLMVNKKGDALQDPFRHSLAAAVQWYDILQVEVEKQIDNAVQFCHDLVSVFKSGDLSTSQSDNGLPTLSELPLHSQCRSSRTGASILIQRCPACFGGNTFGRLLAEGGDIHVATDGNFHHRHRRSSGDCPSFYDPTYFLPKEEVDEMGKHAEKQRKKPPRTYQKLVPDEAVDTCETSYEAADGSKKKAAMDNFDDTGVMALICRHDIPLFFANIDSPGEQQKYALALIQHLFKLLPSDATVVAFYDIGCVTARLVSKHDILGVDIVQRLRFATTAMHAYGHEWACQLVYNPRLTEGLGLSDGEGTECLWSRLIRLIRIKRSSSRKRRIWLLDRHAAAVGHEMCSDLGEWIKRRLSHGVEGQGSAARQLVEDSTYSIDRLREQWLLQKESQLSIRAHAPARLKKQLDTVITLQSDLDTTEKAFQAARNTIANDPVVSESLEVLDGLE
ncbi:hypothetical protein JVU11DRAFT_10780 [Chiua virens]|nr:hypothetical protein JVU11DRAFT_10780 [Chiua virens]